MYKLGNPPSLSIDEKPCSVIRTTDGACIPFDPANTDYQEFLRWKEEGNEPLPSDE